MGFLTQKLQNVAIATRRTLFRARLASDSDLDVIVASPGGVGTTFLIEHLARFRRVNAPHDGDGLKHQPRPPLVGARARPLRFLFVTGELEQISASIARRGWLDRQGAKLGSVATLLAGGDAKRRAFERAVGRQRERWAEPSPDPILFISYDEIWDRVGEIADFLEITDQDFAATFPKRKPRTAETAADVEAAS